MSKKQNKYKRIARNMGFYPHHSNIYGECEKVGLQGAFIELIDKIANINHKLETKTILEKYEIMSQFFNEMQQITNQATKK